MNNLDDFEVLFTEKQIQEVVEKLGKQITEDYKGKNLVLICILKGAVYFAADLSRKIDMDVTLDFMKIKSYTGEVRDEKPTTDYDIKTDIAGKHVLIIEDVIDSGNTLNYLISELSKRNPKSIKFCALLDKHNSRERNAAPDPDYYGFKIDDKFVLGYGLDNNESYRNLPYIGYKVKKLENTF